MELIRDFQNLRKNDTAIAGGKGASLGEMTQAGVSVPAGFVILASAFDRFLEETDINVEIEALLHKLNLKNINSVDRISNEIRDLILDAEFPKDIAKLESYLNTTKQNLLENIKRCWASLFTPRAIFYRFEKKLNKTKVSVAVVIQKMIQSEISGVCFTVHPITKDCDQMVIEAGYGLGETIVGGKITLDTYVVRKKNWIILDKNIGQQKLMLLKNKGGNIEKQVPKSKQEKQKLSEAQILKLSKICRRIEKHYKTPQDIEWVLKKGKFYIVQSRPITTL
jgi:pyruvate,water dikinase